MRFYIQKIIIYFSFLLLILHLSSCSAPMSIIQSGRVTPHKTIRAGVNYNLNISSAPVGQAYKSIKTLATQLINQDSIFFDDQIYNLSKTVVAYSLDPITSGIDFYFRYGIMQQMDLGYKYAGSSHIFDVRYQFLGAGINKKLSHKMLNGSVGLQFSSKSYDLPSTFGLDKIQQILGMEFNRKNFLIPLVFSYDFGENETIGCLAFGLAYNHSFIKYSFKPEKVFKFENNVPLPITKINEKNNFGSIGAFINLKVGYKYIYLLPAIALYFQDFGTYKIIGGNASYKGVTIIPSVGLQFNFFKSRNSNRF